MRTSGRDANYFEGYEEPLSQLENTFRAANVPIKLVLFVAPLNNRMVEITCKNERWKRLVCIEGASPAQAVKDVAAAVSI